MIYIYQIVAYPVLHIQGVIRPVPHSPSGAESLGRPHKLLVAPTGVGQFERFLQGTVAVKMINKS